MECTHSGNLGLILPLPTAGAQPPWWLSLPLAALQDTVAQGPQGLREKEASGKGCGQRLAFVFKVFRAMRGHCWVGGCLVFILCVCEHLSACISGYHVCAVPVGARRGSQEWRLQMIQMFGSRHVGAGNANISPAPGWFFVVVAVTF